MLRNLLSLIVVLGCTNDAAQAGSAKRTPIDPKGPREVAILAGGCFWGMEKVMMDAPGIVDIEVGYAGGKSTKVSYDQVSSGDTGHAESIRVVFDPSQISYEQLLHWYLRGHDPTQVNRQNNDVGPQYRSAIFATNDAQLATARKVKDAANHSHKWKQPIATTIERATTWVRAEDYHQDYLVKHPDGYNDHWLRKFDF
jgi:peptide methionine sulfoxide reductase msrA/msrB